MPLRRVLVANRGEIAVRVIQAARSLQIETVAIFASDDAGSLHVSTADGAREVPGTGVEAYLDIASLIACAREAGCDALHPGYGFLSESAALARACEDAGLTFVGPSPEVLETFGNKVHARRAALAADMPVLAATAPLADDAEARTFFAGLNDGTAVMVKAVVGGGGRGIRQVSRPADLPAAIEQCADEARKAFGDGSVYVEEVMTRARHLEVQLLGDGVDVLDLGDRDCSLQRRRQKLVEIAPAPAVPDALRERIRAAAVALGRSVGLAGAATVELLVDVEADRFVFLEVNPRIQVEHTVTEEVTGADIVAAQLRIAGGARLADLPQIGRPEGFAVQVRLNAETLGVDGSVRPTAGRLGVVDLPTGRGTRVDSAVESGSVVSPRYDSLIAKIIVSDRFGDLPSVLRHAADALDGVRVDGVDTNVDLLAALVSRPEVAAGQTDTTFVDTHLEELLRAPIRRRRAAIDPSGASDGTPAVNEMPVPDGLDAVTSPLPGVVIDVEASAGQKLGAGATVVLVEAMKMEHAVRVDGDVEVVDLLVAPGDVVTEGQSLAWVRSVGLGESEAAGVSAIDLDQVRPELQELWDRRAITADDSRPAAVAKQHAKGHRTARENIADLIDEGSFVEYGSFTVAAQRGRRSLDDLVERTPADGLVCGLATVDGARCVVMAYDYTVLAGTQGIHNHRKQARLLDLAARELLPVIIYAEGGGGRPGDTDGGFTTGLVEQTFSRFAALSGRVPLVAVVNGRCFAGNAALAGCSDVIIATRGSSLGMSGPAMIEGGGLGVVAADDVGPMSVQSHNGVVDVVVEDEAEASAVVRQYVGYFTTAIREGEHPDQRRLRHVVPQSRTRSYDVREVVDTLADTGTALELRAEFGLGIRTWLARIDGRAVGLVANNPLHLGGAIDSPAADKLARFMQLCDAHGLPLVVLCDTPGFMVGPEAERTGSVRKFSRLFVTGAKLRVPLCVVVLRKAYGLGAMAMAGGDLHAPFVTVAWPTGELGPMGIEGAVRLGFRSELEAAPSDERAQLFDRLVAQAYDSGKALNVASIFEIDEVIDPFDTRSVISRVLGAARPDYRAREGFVDTW